MEFKLFSMNNFSTNFYDLNYSNYIILPQSVLEKIKDKELPYYFQLEASNGMKTWVGVKQFTAEESFVVIPQWIMEYLGICGSEIVTLKLEEFIPKAKKIKFQPLQKEFFEIDDYESCLETILSNFCLLHVNLVIEIDILDKKYNLKILDGDYDWEKIDFTKVGDTLIMENNVFDIKDIDIEVEMDNKFLRKELEDKMKREQEERERKELEEKRRQEEQRILEEKNKKLILGGPDHVPKILSKDELRQARLLYFAKKNISKNEVKNEIKSKEKNFDI